MGCSCLTVPCTTSKALRTLFEETKQRATEKHIAEAKVDLVVQSIVRQRRDCQSAASLPRSAIWIADDENNPKLTDTHAHTRHPHIVVSFVGLSKREESLPAS